MASILRRKEIQVMSMHGAAIETGRAYAHHRHDRKIDKQTLQLFRFSSFHFDVIRFYCGFRSISLILLLFLILMSYAQCAD